MRKPRILLIALCSLAALTMLGLAAPGLRAKLEAKGLNSLVDEPEKNLIAVAPPPFSKDIFPCSECHSPTDNINMKPHAVPDHETVTFEHDSENRWCLDCHDAKDRDKLHLADGRLIGFDESYKLCGQCHGPELKDWKLGIHGKRTGLWNGKKEYLLCAHCHDPHSPKTKQIRPLPAPARQETVR